MNRLFNATNLLLILGLAACRQKTKTQFIGIVSIVFLIALFQCSTSIDDVETYPEIPGLTQSDVYKVSVNETDVWTEKYVSNLPIDSLPGWFTSYPHLQKQQEVHIANFSCEGSVNVRIEINESIKNINIRPYSKEIEAHIEGNIATFSLSGPEKLYIEINDLSPLLFYGNPLEVFIPDTTASNVKYFGPGEHSPGLITLNDNDILYIAGGAVVYGGIRLNGSSNVKVLGRGILDGNYQFKRMVFLENGSELEFNGIIIRNGKGWTNTIVNCKNVLYENIKVISFGNSGDGINPVGSGNMIINDCILRCTDDCVAIKSPDSTRTIKNIKISNNTFIGFAFADAVTIGFETNGPIIQDVTVTNCDVLMANGGSMVDGHSAFSIICDGPSEISNIRYENIRVEDAEFKLFELHITEGSFYGINPPGKISDVYLKDIQWSVARPIVLNGLSDSHKIDNVTFENCRVLGDKITTPNDTLFQVNEYVSNLIFK